MSQIIITGEPRFEDVKILVDMLPESDRRALKNYLLKLDNSTSEEEFSALLSRFRSHSRSDEEIEQDVRTFSFPKFPLSEYVLTKYHPRLEAPKICHPF